MYVKVGPIPVVVSWLTSCLDLDTASTGEAWDYEIV